MRITFVNVGYGDAILMESDTGYTALLDGGGNLPQEFEGDPYRVRCAEYLRTRQIHHIDALLISHIHEVSAGIDCGRDKKPPRSLCNKLRSGWKQTRLLNGIPLCNRVRHLARSLTPMLTIPHISAAVNEISHRKEGA